jgi:hypothetical protein
VPDFKLNLNVTSSFPIIDLSCICAFSEGSTVINSSPIVLAINRFVVTQM